MTVEFKSDKKSLSDRELIEALVCLANSEGGALYLGVEDDGTPTGIHKNHTGYHSLPALVANRTTPALAVSVSGMEVAGVTVVRIDVPVSRQIVATTDGVIKRRRIQSDGTPECIPFLPHEFPSRHAFFGQQDVSGQAVAGATLEDLDPVERARIRQFVERFGGDRSLLELDDEALDGALGLTVREGGSRVPTLTGLLLIGREAAIRQFVPTHEIAFQVLDGEEVRLNEFSRAPLLRAFEWIETLFKPLNPEEEFQAGLFRVPVARVEPRAFREAVANAITHRDYTLRGAVHIRMEGKVLSISNPGGLIEGVTLSNLLTTEPRPRNPALADALKRVGLVERTGRGVDLIYRGLLRYGRSQPDYSRSDSHNVVLRLSMAEADRQFLKLVLEEEGRQARALPIDTLITLSLLREHRRISKDEIASLLQRDSHDVGRTLESLVEAGLVQAHGATRSRSYTLSPRVYKVLGEKAEYTRQAGFDRIQQEQMVLSYVKQHGSIRRAEVMELCHLSAPQAYKLLKKLADDQLIEKQGERKGAIYSLKA